MSCGVGHLGFFLLTQIIFILLGSFNDYSCIQFLVSYKKKKSFISSHGSMLNVYCGVGHLGFLIDTNNFHFVKSIQ